MSKTRIQEISDAAWELLAEEGVEALTMRAIAARLEVSAPSLYKHVTNRDEIVALVQARALIEGADALRRAMKRHPAAPHLPAALAYRRWAIRNPAQYRITNDQPLLRDLLPEGLEDECAVPVMELAGWDPDRSRVQWATAHGLISLEIAGRFPSYADVDAAWTMAFGPKS